MERCLVFIIIREMQTKATRFWDVTSHPLGQVLYERREGGRKGEKQEKGSVDPHVDPLEHL